MRNLQNPGYKILKKISLFILLVLISLTTYRFVHLPYQYQLAICAMFKNEAPWLKEWLVYHHDVLGVEHFYLYNNDSTDHYRDVLQPFLDRGIVELIDWSSQEEHLIENYRDDKLVHWALYQLGAYNDCLKKRAIHRAKWVAVIDIDEFIVPVQGKQSLFTCLKTAEKRKKGSIKLDWRMFGTSHIWELNPGELLTEKLTLRAADDDPAHRLGKSIHRPEAIEFCHVHEAGKATPTGFQAGKLKEDYRFRHVHPEEIRIHHYWSRTEKFCCEKRKMKDPKQEFVEAYNCRVDEAILPYLPALKEAMNRYSSTTSVVLNR